LLPQLLRLSHTEKPLKIHTERDSEWSHQKTRGREFSIRAPNAPESLWSDKLPSHMSSTESANATSEKVLRKRNGCCISYFSHYCVQITVRKSLRGGKIYFVHSNFSPLWQVVMADQVTSWWTVCRVEP
jgi:hypothetical protein